MAFLASLFLLALTAQEASTAATVPAASPVTQYTFTYEPVWITFYDSRFINTETIETTPPGYLDFRIAHRFGDMGGVQGTAHNFWGLDQGENIRLAFAYGITNDLSAGIGRARGAATKSPVHELYDGFLKVRVLRQTKDEKLPVSLAVFGNAVVSAQKTARAPSSPGYYPRFDDRLTYTLQPIVARKISERISVALLPTYVRRNRPGTDGRNNFYALGVGGHLKIADRWVILVEYFQLLESDRREGSWSNPLSLALQIPMRGHTFDITLGNTAGLQPNEFLPYLRNSAWDEGEFRLGFNIARLFEIF